MIRSFKRLNVLGYSFNTSTSDLKMKKEIDDLYTVMNTVNVFGNDIDAEDEAIDIYVSILETIFDF